MNQSLMRAVVEYALFLGLSEDTVIDPDTSVSQFEQLSLILKQLTPTEKSEFIRFIKKMAEQESQRTGSEKRVKFLQSLADDLGLTD